VISGGSAPDPQVRTADEGNAVQQDSAHRAGLGKRVGHVALFVALAVVPVLALNSLATADTAAKARPALTDAQQQCLAGHGVSVPDGAAATGIPVTREERHALRAAARACGLRGRADAGMRALPDEQRECLAEHGVSAPPRSAEQRDALRAAAETCGLTKGKHSRGPDAAS
jgi:hypothetical protein